MPFKDLIVYLDAGGSNAARVDTAIALAKRHDARLTGVDISTAAAFEGRWHDQAVGLQGEFERKAGAAGVIAEYRAANPYATSAHELLTHCADLIVASQPHSDASQIAALAVPTDVLMTSGVPLLILPVGWNAADPIGRTITVAWNASREATRAVHDVMPMLVAADKVVLFICDADYDPQRRDVEDIKGHLERHGAKVAVDGWRDTGSTEVVSALFASLDHADLIVAGAYGHSRLSERLFGGATEELLGNVSMPVVLSH